ncbi:uncharacterized protein LOC128093666 [Culex pipiens pallens]|uniref:uncharacterized protein LOC128093666 n=1 Tax=Culex pipiens pallens TaxID=42434 RepID=UPI0022AA4899|nr:uncharacterized protein LOC128093666 [Culex pipiens pallens]
MITVNTFMFIIEPSLGRLPLQVVAIQFILEVYVCCHLFDKLEKMNNKIARYVYVIDWFNVLPRDEANMIQGKCRKSILQNALLLQRQVHGGFKVRAGGMFDLNLVTFANLINLVYSMLTFLLKMY